MSKLREAAAAGLGADTKPKKKNLKLREMRLRRGHKGGFIAKHDMHDPEAMASEDHEYPLASHAELMKHIQQHLPEEETEMAAEQKGEPGE